MTNMEFPGAGLTREQWDRINSLAISLKPGQALWISGFFAGLNHTARTDAVTPPVSGASSRSLTILFGSETGNSAGLAKTLAKAFEAQGLRPTVVDMADYKPRRLKDEQDLLVLTSTHGDGDPPQSAIPFFEFVEGRKAPRLSDVRYAVLALGDSTYERYCEAGKRLDRRLTELGAARLEARVDCDVDYDEPAATWIGNILKAFVNESEARPGYADDAARHAASASASAPSASFDKTNPFPARIIDNIVLSGRGSTKETRHVELSLEGSGLVFEPGDALGLMPRNDPALIGRLLEMLSLRPDAPLVVKDKATTLGEALSAKFEISAATPRFIDHWARISGASELEDLRGADHAEARAAFLAHHHVVDIVRAFPVPGIDPQSFVAGLRPLQPRLYSIASSAAAAPGEAHLTVATVRYELKGEARTGVASGYLANRAEPDTTVPVYIQANPHFRLPDDDTPILMIGAGTGIAPYRAFLQEREAHGARGKSWLVFGERNFRTDFLYQTEWQQLLKDGVLSRMHVAFSRDRAEKTYVQHRLREHARDVYAWLEEGVHLYVCGDAAHLAPDVHAAIVAILQQEGSLGRSAANEYLGNLQRDHRYHIDVY